MANIENISFYMINKRVGGDSSSSTIFENPYVPHASLKKLIDPTLILSCLAICLGMERVVYRVVMDPLVPLVKGVLMDLLQEMKRRNLVTLI